MTPAIAQDAVAVVSRYDARVAHVETIGTLFDGAIEPGGASGLLVGDRYVLTNNHVIPPNTNYRSLEIHVRLRSRKANPIAVRNVLRDAERDLALLELEPTPDFNTVGGNRCPMPVFTLMEQIPVGSWIFIMGYPLNQDQSVSPGLVSNHGDQIGSRWQTSAPINPGNSGGPAFTDTGVLAGLAVGGIVNWSVGGQTRRVEGVNFIIPAIAIRESPLFDVIQNIPYKERCWFDLDPTMATLPDLNPDIAPSDTLTLNFQISETKDDHPVVFEPHSRQYDKTYPAQPGYLIEECEWQPFSQNHYSDVNCTIDDDGRLAVFRFTLTSGPLIDRYRGWMAGTLTLQQRLAQF